MCGHRPRRVAQARRGERAEGRGGVSRLSQASIAPKPQSDPRARGAPSAAGVPGGPRPAPGRCGSPTSPCSTASAAAGSAPTSRPRPSSPPGPGAFDHHLVVPGRAAAGTDSHRHEQPSLQLAASNGYRIPLGERRTAGDATRTQAGRGPAPRPVLDASPGQPRRARDRRRGDRGPSFLGGAACRRAARPPGRLQARAPALVPARLSRGRCRHVGRRPCLDASRPSTLLLRLGLDPAFRPRPQLARGDHVCTSAPVPREGLRELLEAAAAARQKWPLVLLGNGPGGRHPARAGAPAGPQRAHPVRALRTGPQPALAASTRARAASCCRERTRPSGWWRSRPRRAAPRL